MTNAYRKKHGVTGVPGRAGRNGHHDICCRSGIADDASWDAWAARLRSAHPDWTRTRVIQRAHVEALKGKVLRG